MSQCLKARLSGCLKQKKIMGGHSDEEKKTQCTFIRGVEGVDSLWKKILSPTPSLKYPFLSRKFYKPTWIGC